jgi:hypothetical protein
MTAQKAQTNQINPSRRRFLKNVLWAGAGLATGNPLTAQARNSVGQSVLPPLTTELSQQRRRFVSSSHGSGIFGKWILDEAALPAYRYDLDQYEDARAAYPVSDGKDRRDHWHQVGNDRLTALAGNDGSIQFYLADRGGIFLNCQHPESQSYSGGFSYLDDGEAVWCSAYRYRPSGSQCERVFGMGYFKTVTQYRDLRVTRWVHAPFGGSPLLIADIEIENLSDTPRTLRHYEYWDVNYLQLTMQWLRAHPLGLRGDSERRALNLQFTPTLAWDADFGALRFAQLPPADAPSRDTIDTINWYPPDTFLIDLSSGHPPATAEQIYIDKEAFFGVGGPGAPTAANIRAAGNGVFALANKAMPYCLIMRHNLALPAGGKTSLRFGYGAAQPGQDLAWAAQHRHVDTRPQTARAWQEQVCYFSTGQAPTLQREMAWHTYNLLSATVYNEYHQSHHIPQGSAYLFLHGVDGAPRDYALSSLPLCYFRPTLARQTLLMLMRMQHADTGALPYAIAGHGHHSDAEIHTQPSDLDLFFFLALAEYLAATGDYALLQEQVPYYPLGGQTDTALGHVRHALQHLLETIGFGENGLLRVGSGDWSDGIVHENSLEFPFLGAASQNSKQHGESVPNSQMALYVLPLLANQLEHIDPALASAMRAPLAGLGQAVATQWHGQWYLRARLRNTTNQPKIIGDAHIYLESQVWALINNQEPQHHAALIAAICQHLDDPSAVGASLVPNGMVWPAVSQLLTWGYALHAPALAWRSLRHNLFAARAEAFPTVWSNIWSAADGIHGQAMHRPGEAWASIFTPMTDFPVMNANADGMALLALLRVCGIRPTGDGLLISPHWGAEGTPAQFDLETALLGLKVRPNGLEGIYCAANAGRLALYVGLPAGVQPKLPPTAQLVQRPEGQLARFDLSFSAGQQIPFAVSW